MALLLVTGCGKSEKNEEVATESEVQSVEEVVVVESEVQIEQASAETENGEDVAVSEETADFQQEEPQGERKKAVNSVQLLPQEVPVEAENTQQGEPQGERKKAVNSVQLLPQGQPAQVTNSQQEPPKQETVTTTNKQTKTAAIPTNSSNGYNFKMSENCFNDYFNLLKSGSAAGRYENYQAENYCGGTLKYFSICGMAEEEPFLLLSDAGDSNNRADDIMVLLFMTDATGGWYTETIKGMHFDHRNFSMSQFGINNGMYVNIKNDRYDFYAEEAIVYSNTEEREEGWCPFTFNKKKMRGEKGDWNGGNIAQSLIKSGEIAPIKWYSMNQIEEAEKYYSQFIVRPTFSNDFGNDNRGDYFNGNSILKYIPYIEVGYFSVKNEAGKDVFYFEIEEEHPKQKEFYNYFDIIRSNCLFTFQYDGASATDYIYCFYRDENGKEVVADVMRGLNTDKGVWILRITRVEEDNYQKVINKYNERNGTSVSSIAEIYSIYGK